MRHRLVKTIKSPFSWAVKGVAGKTSWEWLELLIVPLFLAIGAFYLENRVESRQERIATERYEQEAEIANARANQELLDNYLEQMQGLLLDRNLRNAERDSEVRSVARAITATTIRDLDGERNALLISFLKEADLVRVNVQQSEEKSIRLLSGLSLVDADLSNADLRGVDLSYSDLTNSNLANADLSHSLALTLSGDESSEKGVPGLNSSSLDRFQLAATDLESAELISANLTDANLFNANLEKTDFTDTNLTQTILGKGGLFSSFKSNDTSSAKNK